MSSRKRKHKQQNRRTITSMVQTGEAGLGEAHSIRFMNGIIDSLPFTSPDAFSLPHT